MKSNSPYECWVKHDRIRNGLCAGCSSLRNPFNSYPSFIIFVVLYFGFPSELLWTSLLRLIISLQFATFNKNSVDNSIFKWEKILLRFNVTTGVKKWIALGSKDVWHRVARTVLVLKLEFPCPREPFGPGKTMITGHPSLQYNLAKKKNVMTKHVARLTNTI